jgi:integrase
VQPASGEATDEYGDDRIDHVLVRELEQVNRQSVEAGLGFGDTFVLIRRSERDDVPKLFELLDGVVVALLVEPEFAWRRLEDDQGHGARESVQSCPPEGGYAATLRAALARAKVDRPMRPFHDGRHTSITNKAAAGVSPAALMAIAGHSDFKTTQGYIDLAGETFRDEAELAEQRMLGQKSGQK